MLTALSPLDGRYQRQTAPLGPYFSELALMRYRVRVVAATGALFVAAVLGFGNVQQQFFRKRSPDPLLPRMI